MPKAYARITNHKKPRYQLYRFGFNRHNSCWLSGSWETVTQEEWEARKDAHVRVCKDIQTARNNQHYQNSGVSVEDMTPEQRAAWEWDSGTQEVYTMTEDGNPGKYALKSKADRIPLK